MQSYPIDVSQKEYIPKNKSWSSILEERKGKNRIFCRDFGIKATKSVKKSVLFACITKILCKLYEFLWKNFILLRLDSFHVFSYFSFIVFSNFNVLLFILILILIYYKNSRLKDFKSKLFFVF